MQSVRHVTIYYAEIADLPTLTSRLGDEQASTLAQRLRTLQEAVITRDDLGQIVQTGSDFVYAVFDAASVALSRALELHRLCSTCFPPETGQPQLRVGLHMGEVLIRNGDQIELVGRHLNRARRIAESAAAGQILASEPVIEAARDFIDLPPDALGIQHYGEYHLADAGPTPLSEITDLRFRTPAPPPIAANRESSVISRLEFAGYTSLERIGEGPHGVVYRAINTQTRTPVALKVINGPLIDKPGIRRQLLFETDRLIKLNLAGVVTPAEQRLDHRPPFQITELIHARPADIALEHADSTSIAVTFHYVCQILEKAHQADVLHGNIKAGNVLVHEDGSAVLLDFTVRLLDQPGRNEPASYAPESLRGHSRSAQTDIYALGVLLFRVITRKELFARPTLHQVIQAHLHEDPPLPATLAAGVADGLQRICLKALEKNPNERYRSISEMRSDLDRFLDGEAVRTRPSLYDNLLYHRVRRQVTEVEAWADEGLLTDEERDRLTASYEGLQRRGIPALMEGSLFRFWQTLVYVGGWALVNGALLWLIQEWDELGRGERLVLGSVPAVTSFGLGWAMWKMDRFRLTFVALVVGILAMPVLAGVWLHEFQIADSVGRYSHELFHDTRESAGLTNQQLCWISLATLLVAAVIGNLTRTTTHSAQALFALVALYGSCLLILGLKARLTAEVVEWGTLALQFAPLLLLCGLVISALLQTADRQHQALPWIHFNSVLAVAVVFGISRFGLRDWLGITPPLLAPASWLATTAGGVLLVVAGVFARGQLRHRGRPATLGVVVMGLIFILGGLALSADGNWPEEWWAPTLFAKAVPASHLLLPLVSLAITLFACRYQMIVFLLLGLAGFSLSIHFLGRSYFSDTDGWPMLVMIAGTVTFFAALYIELRRTRGNTLDDIIRTTRL